MPTFAPFDRRRFLWMSAAAVSVRSLAQTGKPTPAMLRVRPDKAGPSVPASFIGLSYETEQLTDPAFFSPANTGLIAQFRALAPQGVLRLGGNTSDVGWWKPTPTTARPEIRVRSAGVVGEPTAELAYPITPQAITNLRGFLDATGWSCLYGINLGTNTPARAAEEADFVARTLGWIGQGGKLEYFQLGNEPDLFSTHLRDPKTWTADAYFDEWLTEARAIEARVPEARFSLPDTAGNPEWYATVVTRLLALRPRTCPCELDARAACSCAVAPGAPPLRPRIASLTHHYYFGGPPASPDVNIDRLLRPDPKVTQLAQNIAAATVRLNAGSPPPAGGMLVPYRMTEGNTCYRGGKPGVSDVFAAALWAADYALRLASLGYAGVNLHGGTGQFVANSLGGHLPGDDIVTAQHGEPASHPHPYYTPIAGYASPTGTRFLLQPTGYGLLFARQFAGATMLPMDFDPGPVNATAYAARLTTGQIAIAILNKDATQALAIDVPGYSLARTLTASSLESRTVHFDEPATFREASTVAPASAVLLLSTRA